MGLYSPSPQEGDGLVRGPELGSGGSQGVGTFAKALPLPLMALVWGKQGGSRNRQTAALAGPRPMLVWCVCVCVCVCVPTTGRRGGQQGVGVLVGKMMCTRGKGCVFCVRTQGCVQGWTLLCLYTHTHTRTHTHTHTHTHTLSVRGPAAYLEGRRLCVCLCVHWGSLCPGQRWPDCGVSGVPKKRDDWDGGADPCWVRLRRNVVRGT